MILEMSNMILLKLIRSGVFLIQNVVKTYTSNKIKKVFRHCPQNCQYSLKFQQIQFLLYKVEYKGDEEKK